MHRATHIFWVALPCLMMAFGGSASAQRHLQYPERAAYPLRQGDTLWVCKRDIDCHIIRGDSIVSEQMTYTPVGEVMKPLSLWGTDDLFLVQVYAGDGCPALYEMVDASGDSTSVTGGIGNCNEPDAVLINTEQVVFKFSADPETNRKGGYFVYSRLKRRVSEFRSWRPKNF